MEIWNFLTQHFDLPQLIAFAVMLWFMKSSMEKNINKRFEKIEERLLKLENDMIEVKTILRMQECCMIKDERKLPRVE